MRLRIYMTIVRFMIVNWVGIVYRIRIVNRTWIWMANQPIIPWIIPTIAGWYPGNWIIASVIPACVPGVKGKIDIEMPASIGIIIIIWMQPGIWIVYDILHSLNVVSVRVVGLSDNQPGGLKLKLAIFFIVRKILLVIIGTFII
jgi:hypothetical protein